MLDAQWAQVVAPKPSSTHLRSRFTKGNGVRCGRTYSLINDCAVMSGCNRGRRRYDKSQSCHSIDDNENGVISLSGSGKAHNVIHGDICESSIMDFLKGGWSVPVVWLLTFAAFTNMVSNIGLPVWPLKSSSDCRVRGFFLP